MSLEMDLNANRLQAAGDSTRHSPEGYIVSQHVRRYSLRCQRFATFARGLDVFAQNVFELWVSWMF
jgi:hypothetical protein